VLVASFLAAYMSTVSTQLNWGASYVINDVYRRFVRPSADQRELVRVSRITTLLIMGLSLTVTALLGTISGAWTFIIEAGAGLGLVLILRWFWWRVNAWSELAAMVAPLVVLAFVRSRTAIGFPESLYLIVGATTVAWVIATFATPAVDMATLVSFYRRVRPGGPGWRPVARRCPEVRPDAGFAWLFVDWIAGVALVYAVLFAVGGIIFGEWMQAAVLASLAAICAAVLARSLSRSPEPSSQ
jgi:hypothetical protein